MFLKEVTKVEDVIDELITSEDYVTLIGLFESIHDNHDEDSWIEFKGALHKFLFEMNNGDEEIGYWFFVDLTVKIPENYKVIVAYLEYSWFNYIVTVDKEFVRSFTDAMDVISYLERKFPQNGN